MTSRERFLNHMNFRAVDRCFNMETGFWGEVFDQVAGVPRGQVEKLKAYIDMTSCGLRESYMNVQRI